jgi:hypothetical protein
MDVFNAGVGNDDIVINASNITALEQVGVGNRAQPMAITSSPLFPNTLRTLVLLEACNTSSKLSFIQLLMLNFGFKRV